MAQLTISDAARRCGVARRTLQRAVRAGRLALTPDHRVTLAALQHAGYTPATETQGDATATPLRQGRTSQAMTQGMSQGLSQALSPLVDRLDSVIALLEALRHTLEQQDAAAAPRRQDARLSQGHAAATPPEPPPDPVLAQIRRWQDEGMTLRAIAARLNAEGVPTRSGQGKWYQSNLSRLLARTAQRQAPHA
jgi:hypothetical protein